MAAFTSIEDVQKMVLDLRNANPQNTIPIKDRKHIIERIKAWLIERADDLRAAEHADLRRDVGFHDKIRGGCIGTCNYYLENLDRLAADQPCADVAPPKPGARARRSYVRRRPRGLALVIGTWNFPLRCT